MGIFSMVIVAQSTTMVTITEAKSLERRTVGAKPVGKNPLRLHALILQQPAQQSSSCSRIAPLLHDHVHHLAFVIDRTPDPHALACNGRDEFIKTPARRWWKLATVKIGDDPRDELHRHARIVS